MSETDDWYGGTERSTPICGECGFFRVDAKRTGTYRLGWCAKRNERHDRCDLMPICQDGLLGNPKPTKKEVKEKKQDKDEDRKYHNHKKVLCVTTGEVFQTVRDAGKSVGLSRSAFCVALKRSPDGQCERRGKVFRYLDRKEV